jgi:hypothetical protein
MSGHHRLYLSSKSYKCGILSCMCKCTEASVVRERELINSDSHARSAKILGCRSAYRVSCYALRLLAPGLALISLPLDWSVLVLRLGVSFCICIRSTPSLFDFSTGLGRPAFCYHISFYTPCLSVSRDRSVASASLCLPYVSLLTILRVPRLEY